VSGGPIGLGDEILPAEQMIPSLVEADFPAFCLELTPDFTRGTIAANFAYSDLLGMHVEEALARTVYGERPFPMSEVRLMNCLLVMLRKENPLASETIYSATVRNGSFRYLRFTFKNTPVITPTGMRIRVIGTVLTITAGEYEKAVAINPNICDSLGLPFLSSAPDPANETFEALSQTPEGHEKMNMIAGAYRRLFKELF